MKRKKTLSQKIDEYQEEWASRLGLGDITLPVYEEGIFQLTKEHMGLEAFVDIDLLKMNFNKLLDDLEEGL